MPEIDWINVALDDLKKLRENPLFQADNIPKDTKDAIHTLASVAQIAIAQVSELKKKYDNLVTSHNEHLYANNNHGL